VSGSLTIGEFARLTHLTVKALRHYHDVGLLEPARIDGSSGYRRYDSTQVAAAQLVKRLRELDMPLPDVKAVLAAPNAVSRDSAIATHLERMERQLDRTRELVTSLRALLGAPAATATVELRRAAAIQALGVRAVVERDALAAWCGDVYPALYETAARTGATVTGPAGGVYSQEFFESDAGDVLAFIPVTGGTADIVEIPAADLAVMVHAGPFTDLDITYGALGGDLAERGISAAGPIREHYLVGPDHTDDPTSYRTEVCWPIHPQGD